VMAD